MKDRRSVLSKKIQVKNIGDALVTLYMFEDLTDEELSTQFNYYLDREDFEYLQEIVAEATLRGLKFKIE